jgi:hypothetical protein
MGSMLPYIYIAYMDPMGFSMLLNRSLGQISEYLRNHATQNKFGTSNVGIYVYQKTLIRKIDALTINGSRNTDRVSLFIMMITFKHIVILNMLS